MKKIADYLNKSAVKNIKAALEQAKDAKTGDSPASLVEKRALKRAKQVDAGEITGKLAGVPFVVKNSFLIFDAKMMAGSKILERFEAPYQATVVEKLEAEGAICIGSSANPAKAVALGVVPFALGLDTDNSIIQPAVSGDVFGFKPTYGMVSRYGIIGAVSSMDAVSISANSAADIEQVLDVVSGLDSADMTTLPDYFTPIDKLESSLRIAVIDELMDDSSPEAAAKIDQYINNLVKQGHKVERVSIPLIKYAEAIYQVVASAELSSNMSRFDGVRYGGRSGNAHSLEEVYTKTRAEFLRSDTKLGILLGNLVLSSDYYKDYYLQAQKVRTLLIQELQQAFNKYDVLVGPMAPIPALLAGLPAVNMPVGQMAAPKSDSLLLALVDQVGDK